MSVLDLDFTRKEVCLETMKSEFYGHPGFDLEGTNTHNNFHGNDIISAQVSKVYEKNFNAHVVTPDNVMGLFGINASFLLETLTLRDQERTRIQALILFPDEQIKSHYVIFQRAMKYLLLWGQFWGLNPVLGIWDENPLKVKFKIGSIRFWYSVLLLLFELGIACVYLVTTFKRVTISLVAFLCFFSSTSIVTLLMLRTASKWPTLAQKVSTSNLVVNPNVVFKCNLVSATMMSFAILEHALSLVAHVTNVVDCHPDEEAYGSYIQRTFTAVFSLGVQYHITVALFLQFVSLASTMNWNYSDVLIICISLYLTSVLEEINKKITWAAERDVPPSYWRALREAYTRASRLVRAFDEAISQVLLVSFATSLFFMCLQIFNVLAHGFHATRNKDCPNYPSGPFYGYEHAVYFIFSSVLLLVRSILVALIAANVHLASKAAVSPLHSVPTSRYCEEVQRFIEQVHGDTVALSGCDFFIMSRDLVLSVASAIVTYELVLLQFDEEI